MNIELMNWVKDGRHMIRTLNALSVSPLLSSELASRLSINRASMSGILRALKERGLVSAISGKSRTVTYIITKKGLDALKNPGGAKE